MLWRDKIDEKSVQKSVKKSVQKFKATFASKNTTFSGSEQQDSQEFLLFLLHGLHEDVNRGTPIAIVDTPIDSEPVDDMVWGPAFWEAHLSVNRSVIVDMCHGQYRTKTTCDCCKTSSVKFDKFLHLSLPLVTTNISCTLNVSVSCVSMCVCKCM